jgi:PAS domain S-box-containing protein
MVGGFIFGIVLAQIDFLAVGVPFAFAASVFGFLIHLCNRYRRLRLASQLSLGSIFAILLFATLRPDSNGVLGLTYSGMIVPIMLAGYLFGGRAALVTAGICSAVAFSQAQYQMNLIDTLDGNLVSINFSREDMILHWSARSVFFFVQAGLLAYFNSVMNGAIRRAEQGERTLAEGNAALKREITERKQAEAALKHSEQRFLTAFQANPSALAICAVADGRFVDVNDAWTTLLGYSRTEAVGRTYDDLRWQHPSQPAHSWTQVRMRWLDKTNSTPLEIVGQARHGKTIFGLLSAQPMEIEGKPHLLLTLQDIGERKDAERRELALTEQTARVAALTDFLSNISHDLKTPITTIKMNLYVLDHLNVTEKQGEKLAIIKQQTARLEKSIQDLLTMSRLDSKHKVDAVQIDINGLVSQLAARARSQLENRRLKLQLVLQDELPAGRGDLDELAGAITNLIDNAIFYSREGGTVTLRTFERETMVVIEVADTGIGIAPEEIERIFERHYRADPARSLHTGGTGLGLAIVKRVMEMLNGAVEVDSELGKGSRFRLVLPTFVAAKRPTKPAQPVVRVRPHS